MECVAAVVHSDCRPAEQLNCSESIQLAFPQRDCRRFSWIWQIIWQIVRTNASDALQVSYGVDSTRLAHQ